MSIDLSHIEKAAAQVGDEYWKDIRENITHNFYQIIGNDALTNAILKYKIDVEFSLDNDTMTKVENDPNAYAKMLSDKKYEIAIGKKLLILLRHYSYKIIDYNTIFPDLIRNDDNREILRKISDAIFYYWMDFVCLHEWSHIVKGHLNYVHRYPSDIYAAYYEFNVNQNQQDNILYFEIDADRFAGKLLLGRFVLSLQELKKHFNFETESLLLAFNIGMLYLFDLFFLLSGHKRESHPAPFDRMVLLNTAFSEALYLYPSLLDNMTEQKLMELTQESFNIFFKEHGEDYARLDYNELIKGVFDLLDGYKQFLRNVELSKYQILKH